MFAKRLRDLREKNNLQQKELAKELDVLEATISMWETGKRVPYSDMLIKLANFFDVSVDYLLGNDLISNEKEKELREQEALKKALQRAGFMTDDEDLTDKELERVMNFVANNKDLLKDKQK